MPTTPFALEPALNSADSPLGIGVVGLGFMGKAHLHAYADAILHGHHAKIIAVADTNAERRAGVQHTDGNIGKPSTETMFETSQVTAYENEAVLFADDRVQLVSICTPTDTHIALATQALNAGKHVLLEKPVALTANEVSRLADAADAAEGGRVCIPAMCMRFWPAWAWLKHAIIAGSFGPVRTARFERLGAAPTWGQEFFQDITRSGGALFDLHIHDADFVVHCFGVPESVTTQGDHERRAHVCTTYHYPNGPESVQAEGGWLSSPHFPSRMRYTVEFEHAVADFDLARDPQLIVYTAEGTTTPKLEPITGYDGEIRLAIEAAISGIQPSPSLREAAIVTRVLQAEAQSLDTGKPVNL